MANRATDILFQLIQTLKKAEKRNFKLYIKRSSSNEELKIIQLFDALDKMAEYDETVLLKRVPTIKKQQLSNIKAHLYKEILASLRLLNNENYISIQLNEQLDHARILYNKGLYMQSLKILERVKEIAKPNNQYNFLIQVLTTEKKIESLHITRSMQDRAEQLREETDFVIDKIKTIGELSNLALGLYSWYIKHGHARNTSDEEALLRYFKKHLPADHNDHTGFYECLYLYQCFAWYGYITQHYLMYYKYTEKWVRIFKQFPHMLDLEPAQYIKGIHNLLNAHFNLRNYKGFDLCLKEFETFADSEIGKRDFNNEVHIFVYLTTAKMNSHFLKGTFQDGLALIPNIEEKVNEYGSFLDRHRIMIFNYKIASLYFGNGNYSEAIDYLQKIINSNADLRNDLQCYARLMHLIAHYELGNYTIIEYLIKSVYRFMVKKSTLTVVEEEIFKFLKNTFHISPRKMQPEFEKLLNKVKALEQSRYATRSFAYLDIISWLESKVSNTPIKTLIQNRYKMQTNKRQKGEVV